MHELSRQISSLRAEVDYYKKELIGLRHRAFAHYFACMRSILLFYDSTARHSMRARAFRAAAHYTRGCLQVTMQVVGLMSVAWVMFVAMPEP